MDAALRRASRVVRGFFIAAVVTLGIGAPAFSETSPEQAKDIASRTFAENLGRGASTLEPVAAANAARRGYGSTLQISAAQVSITGRREPPSPAATGISAFSDEFSEGFAKTLMPAIRIYVQGFAPVRGTWVPTPYYFLTTAAAIVVGLVLAPIATSAGIARGLFAAVAGHHRGAEQ